MTPRKQLLTTFSVLLIAALLVACVAPAVAPTATSVPPTAIPVPPTPTSVPPTPEPTPVAVGAGKYRCAGAIAAARGVTS